MPHLHFLFHKPTKLIVIWSKLCFLNLFLSKIAKIITRILYSALKVIFIIPKSPDFPPHYSLPFIEIINLHCFIKSFINLASNFISFSQLSTFIKRSHFFFYQVQIRFFNLFIAMINFLITTTLYLELIYLFSLLFYRNHFIFHE